MGIAAVGSEILAGFDLPLTFVEFGKPGIAFEFVVYPCQVKARGARQGLTIQAGPADQHDLARRRAQFDRLVDSAGDVTSGGFETGFAGDDDVLPPG